MAISFMLALESSSFAADSFPFRSNWMSRELPEKRLGRGEKGGRGERKRQNN